MSDCVKPTMRLETIRTVLDFVVDEVRQPLNEAMRLGAPVEPALLRLERAQREIRRGVERSHRARVAASQRPPGPRLTRVPFWLQDGVVVELANPTGGKARDLFVFARPGDEL